MTVKSQNADSVKEMKETPPPKKKNKQKRKDNTTTRSATFSSTGREDGILDRGETIDCIYMDLSYIGPNDQVDT